MPKLTIDGREVEVAVGATILDAAHKLGIEIPILCFRQNYRPQASCMVCVVRVNGSDTLVPSCATKAEDGMEVESETEQVKTARRTALELLLGDHLGDCVGPCQAICPAHMDIPTMIRLIAEGRTEEAVATVKQHIPIPAVLGRICPELCEKGCRRGDLDSPIAIRLLKRHVGDYDIAADKPYVPECRPLTGKKVAIIGAGPAGLSAAYYLLQAGHACTVFDDREQPGGMLRYGVPEQALPRKVLDAEIHSIVRLGLELRPGKRVGRDIDIEDLSREFDAVLVASGEMSEETSGGLGLLMAAKGLQADRSTQMTATPGIFVAGSALSPSRHAVRAVSSGRAAACAIAQYLAGEPISGTDRPYTVRMGRLNEQEMATFSAGTPAYDRLVPAAGEAIGFSDEQARAEAQRCLHCECPGLHDCKLRKWAMLYQASPTRYRGQRRTFQRETTHPGLIYEPGKCIACGLCIQIAENARERLGLTFVGRGFDVVVSVPFGEPLAAGLEKVARECAEACPTAALALRAASAGEDTDEIEPVQAEQSGTVEGPTGDGSGLNR